MKTEAEIKNGRYRNKGNVGYKTRNENKQKTQKRKLKR